MTNEQLCLEAIRAMHKAYAPYSGYMVGAALIDDTGKVTTGCNIENSSYGATICAERTAMVKAISEGARDFQSIAIAGNGGTSWPCGICRQFMYEFCPDIRVISGENEDELQVYTLKELLPEGFKL